MAPPPLTSANGNKANDDCNWLPDVQLIRQNTNRIRCLKSNKQPNENSSRRPPHQVKSLDTNRRNTMINGLNVLGSVIPIKILT